MTEIDFDSLNETTELEEILILRNEAKKYLENFRWCKSTKSSWYSREYCIYEKIGVFLFEIEPLDESIDKFIWIIVGDLPPAYLDSSVITAKNAIEVYCELMSAWAEKIQMGMSVDECFPIEAEPTLENARLLKSRIGFIKRELLLENES